MMKLANRKKFIQRTNDFRAKSFVDYISSSPTALESPDLYLFGLLIGVQPKARQFIRKGNVIEYLDASMFKTYYFFQAWSHIATSIYVISYCERCIKGGFIQDSMGNPTAAEFKEKLGKAFTKIAIANTTIKSYDQSQVMPARKALKTLEVLLSAENPYWSFTPLSAACVEYNCRPPWGPDALSKLLNVVFMMILSSNQNGYSSAAGRGVSRQASQSSRIRSSVSGNTVFSNQANENVDFEGPPSPTLSTSVKVFGTVPEENSLNVNTAVMASDELSVDRSATPSRVASAALPMNKASSSKLPLFRLLETLTKEFWTSTRSKFASQLLGNKEQCLEYLSSLQKQYLAKNTSQEQLRNERYGFVPLTIDDAITLLNTVQQPLVISISELCIACIYCWQAEYNDLKEKLSRGTVNVMRRNAVAGFYDSSQASMTAVERLALTRLLHWYNYLKDGDDDNSEAGRLHISTSGRSVGNSRGMNWDDVQENYHKRNFPFEIPESLMLKSRNELNFLAESLRLYIIEYDKKNALEDSLAAAGPYSKHAREIKSRGSQKMVYNGEANRENVVSVEEIERFQKSEYLKSQSLGGISNGQRKAESESQSRSSRVLNEEQEQAVEQYRKEISENMRVLSGKNSGRVSTDPPLTTSNTLLPLNRPRSPLGVGYQSPDPARLPMSMVEIVDIEPSILSTVGLLSRPASGVHATTTTRRTGDATSLEIEVEHFAGLGTEHVHQRRQNAMSMESFSLSVPSSPNLEKLLKVDNYSATVSAHRKAVVSAARLRVQARMKNHFHSDEASDGEEANIPSPFQDDNSPEASSSPSPTASAGGSFEESVSREGRRRKSKRALGPASRYAQFLDVKQFIDKNGEINIDLKTHMSVENQTRILIMKDASISLPIFKKLLDSYMKQKQLEQLIRLDISGNRLALDGAVAVSLKLRNYCRLVHLSLNGMDIGDMGLKVLFNAIITSEGQQHLLRLDIQRNGITLATPSFSLISNFSNLR